MAKELGVRPLIICPRSIITPWIKTAEGLDVYPIDVLNIERLKTGKTPYLKRVGKNKWVWTLARDSLLIYDEVQSASGYNSQNGKILGLCKAYGIRVLMASATVADSPMKLRAIGYLLGLFKWPEHYRWCINHGCYINSRGGMDFIRGPRRLQYIREIHGNIFPEKGCRIRIQDLDTFPENSVFAEAYDLGKRSTAEFDRIFAEMDEEISSPDPSAPGIVLALRARQRTELLKSPVFLELTENWLEEGKSVVVFVNFRETLSVIKTSLEKSGHNVVIIQGGQTGNERDEQLRLFQSNEARVCLAMFQAGGIGVNLQDLNGKFPRASLISPGYNAVQMKQALGRIHRSGGKSKCIQKIIFAAGTVEEEACQTVRRKLDNIDMLNDGDLTVGLIQTKEKD